MKPHLFALLLIGLCGCEQEAFNWQGYVEGDSLLIAAPVAGKLQSLTVQEGDWVDAQQPLFALDPEPDGSVLKSAQAQADAAAAQLADLQKGSRPEELAVIEAQYAQAKAAAELSMQQLQRVRSLVEKKLEGQEALDEITAQDKLNRKRLDEMTAHLKTAQLSARSDRIDAAEAQVRAAQAEVAQVEWRLREKNQYAPQAALVQDILFRPGEFVAAGQPVLALLPPSQIKIRFFVPETQLARVQQNQTVIVSCDGCEKTIQAKVQYISPRAEYTPPFIYSKENRSKFVYLVEARVTDDIARKLNPGQPVDVTWQ